MQGSPAEADLDTLEGLAWYVQRRPVFTGGNEVRLLKGGEELFPTLRDRIDAAQHSIWMAFYMVTTLGQASWVLQALMRAARRGVSVHLVVDGLGSREAPASLWEDLTRSGVKLATYRPTRGLGALVFDTSQWRRMHLKIAVIDRSQACIGGINLIDDRYDLQHGWSQRPRLDSAATAAQGLRQPLQRPRGGERSCRVIAADRAPNRRAEGGGPGGAHQQQPARVQQAARRL